MTQIEKDRHGITHLNVDIGCKVKEYFTTPLLVMAVTHTTRLGKEEGPRLHKDISGREKENRY